MRIQARRWAMTAGVAGWIACAAAAGQQANRVIPQASAEDVLAALVHDAAVIFAGQVYAIRMPQGVTNPAGVHGGLPSSHPDAVEVEFRVDMGIRGASIGSNYVLRMPLTEWQQAPPFTLHQHAVTFLAAANSAGFAQPVQGESDLPGMDLGVMPIDASNQVDLSRLERLVTHKTLTSAPPPTLPTDTPAVPDVTTQSGEETLVSGSNQGQMPELRNATVPFLALVRDVTVLSAAESQQAEAAPAK